MLLLLLHSGGAAAAAVAGLCLGRAVHAAFEFTVCLLLHMLL